jgi:microcystin-dependent protein
MSEPFAGEIRMFAGNFAPRGWALCDGQLLAVSQNDALFSLLGTIYGGDGRSTFALPEMHGRIPLHAGQGPGLSSRRLGSRGGQETETLTTNQMPPHNHTISVSSNDADSKNPVGKVVARSINSSGDGRQLFATSGNANILNSAAFTATGGSQSHTNLMPSLCVNFIVALFGIYPSRN